MSEQSPKRFSEYQQGLDWVRDWAYSRANLVLGIIVNGSGSGVGKTTFIGDLLGWLNEQGLRTADYTDDPQILADRVRYNDVPTTVVVQQTQQENPFGKLRHDMRVYMLKQFVGTLTRVLGREPDQTLLINLDTPNHPFPPDAIPADVYISNDKAK